MFKAEGHVVLKLAGKGCVQVYCYYILLHCSCCANMCERHLSGAQTFDRVKSNVI